MYHFDYAPYDEQCMEISLDLLSHLGAILIPISDMTRTAWGSEINLELQESSRQRQALDGLASIRFLLPDR